MMKRYIMDIFSHALLPYLFGCFFKRKKEEITAFVIGGIAPDFDVSLLWINYLYPTPYLITHRGITHSLFFGFFTGIAVLYLAYYVKNRTNISKLIDFKPVITPRTTIFAYAGVILHLFLDYTTTHGAPLFYPFDATRYSAEVFFYTDIYLTVLSLIIIILLYKQILQTNTSTRLLIVFLILFAGLGTVRIAEKSSAEHFFQDVNINTYPTMNPFDWYVVAAEGDKIQIYEYNGFENKSIYSETVLRMKISSNGENLSTALDAAGELPQIKMFKWRAYTVAIDAFYSNKVWLLEYYDPVQKAMLRSSPVLFRRTNSPIRVKVEAGRAVLN